MSLLPSKPQPIQAEQVRLLYVGGISTILTGAVLASLLAVAQQASVGSMQAFGWLAGVWLITFVRISMVRAYQRAAKVAGSDADWLTRFRLGVFASASIWGLASILLFPPHEVMYQTFLAFTLAAVTTGAVIAYSIDFVSIAGYMALALLPFAIRAFSEGAPVPSTMGMMSLLFLGYSALNVRRLSSHLVENISLRFQADSGKTQLMQKDADLKLLNERLTALIEAIPDAIFFKDGNGRWLITNETAKRLFKLHGFKWRGLTERELAEARPEFRAAHEGCLVEDERAWEAGTLTISQEQVVGDNGAVHDFEVRKMPVFGRDGRRKALVVIGRDITERRAAERELLIAAAAFDVQEGIIISDADGVIVRVNRAFSRLTGYGAEEVIGKSPTFLRSDRHDALFYQQMQEKLQTEGFWQGEIWHLCKDGASHPHWQTISTIKGANGEVTNFIGTFSDISQYKEAEEAIHTLAYFDQLTNLPNRRLLLDRLRQALVSSVRHKHHGAILFIDLDNFKTLNDSRGHAIGDLLLIEVALRLTASVRVEDTVARLGGDEFVVMLEGLSEQAEQAATYAEIVGTKILEALNQPYLLNGYEHHSTPSIGVSLFQGENESVEDLLKYADAAMYQAKQSGRNTLRFFDPAMQASLEARLSIEADLRQALPQQQLKLYYQPQVNEARQVIGAEVLLRWQHPTRGLVSPAQFIPIAEDNGLIVPIGFWVLKEACAQLKHWEPHPYARSLKLSVNISARQFRQPDLVDRVRQVLLQTEVNPARLKLELTESLVLDNVSDTIAKMHALKALGLSFSMDDFGTGHSSLAHLKRLPLDEVKIDQSFVRDITSDPNDAAIVHTIIAMTETLGLNVIAEGVETEAQLQFLKLHGCQRFQGYLFGKPVALTEFESFIV